MRLEGEWVNEVGNDVVWERMEVGWHLYGSGKPQTWRLDERHIVRCGVLRVLGHVARSKSSKDRALSSRLSAQVHTLTSSIPNFDSFFLFLAFLQIVSEISIDQ